MNRKKILILIVIAAIPALAVFIFNGCKKLELTRIAAVSTGNIEYVTQTQARLQADIIDLGENNSVTDYGFCWTIGINPTINDNNHGFGSRSSTGSFDYFLSGLYPGTKYYVRAYLKQGSEVYYGATKSFETDGSGEDLPVVTTTPVTNITQTTAFSGGNVTDQGSTMVTARGVCWSKASNPDLSDAYTSDGDGSGSFTSNITGLTSETIYYVRAYATNESGTSYGSQISFQTASGSGPSPKWFFWDNGSNYTSIGFSDTQTDFDVAIRFTPEDLQGYNGFNITDFRFFVVEGYPVEYYVTWWTGLAPTFIDYEAVPYPVINGWTDYAPSYIHTIDASQELWVGLWVVGAPAGTYPMGVDGGPAIAEKGDLISTDEGESWQALSIANPTLDYNWNLEVYVTNQKGEKIELMKKSDRQSKLNSNKNNGIEGISCAKPSK